MGIPEAGTLPGGARLVADAAPAVAELRRGGAVTDSGAGSTEDGSFAIAWLRWATRRLAGPRDGDLVVIGDAAHRIKSSWRGMNPPRLPVLASSSGFPICPYRPTSTISLMPLPASHADDQPCHCFVRKNKSLGIFVTPFVDASPRIRVERGDVTPPPRQHRTVRATGTFRKISTSGKIATVSQPLGPNSHTETATSTNGGNLSSESAG
jgi:hypothetical protein